MKNNGNLSAVVFGAGGFIGNHLVNKLKMDGFWVRGVDLKKPEFSETSADEFVLADLRDSKLVEEVCDRPFDEAYQLAADMGGAGFIFTGDNDADIMHNSAMINLNVVELSPVLNDTSSIELIGVISAAVPVKKASS